MWPPQLLSTLNPTSYLIEAIRLLLVIGFDWNLIVCAVLSIGFVSRTGAPRSGRSTASHADRAAGPRFHVEPMARLRSP